MKKPPEESITGHPPRIGSRVRRSAEHPQIPVGMLGTIDVVHEDGLHFWVATDDGGVCGWTSFDEWTPEKEARAPA